MIIKPLPSFIFFISTFLFSNGWEAKAQSDYVVTIKGDTLKGELTFMPFSQSDRELYNVLFDRLKIISKGQKTVYNSLQIKEFVYGGVHYESVKFENAYRFMKILKAGYLGLYSFSTSNSSSWDGRYLYKKHGFGIEVPHIGFKKILAKFLSDCPEVRTQIKNGDLKRDDLEKIIELYNSYRETRSKS